MLFYERVDTGFGFEASSGTVTPPPPVPAPCAEELAGDEVSDSESDNTMRDSDNTMAGDDSEDADDDGEPGKTDDDYGDESGAGNVDDGSIEPARRLRRRRK